MSALQLEIEASNKKWMDAFARKDSKAIGDCYTEDGKVLPTGMDVVTGREGCGKVFQGAMDGGIDSVLLKSDEVGPMGVGDIAFERGHYIFYKKDGSIADEGKYVVIWKRVNGELFMWQDIWNSNK